MQSNKMAVARDEIDRLIMMRMDLDKYEAETIPNLQHQAALLHQALLEYGCHKSSCGISHGSATRCTCGLAAAIGNGS
jgi:hypothetical protein